MNELITIEIGKIVFMCLGFAWVGWLIGSVRGISAGYNNRPERRGA